jgi:formamidopyrimidine-DNA glycosylase
LALLHDHVELRLDDGRTIVYHDPRRFGRLDVLRSADVERVVGPGVDALDASLTGAWLFRALGDVVRRASVKSQLMDQRQNRRFSATSM